jgi:hypothetical protein
MEIDQQAERNIQTPFLALFPSVGKLGGANQKQYTLLRRAD